MTTGAKSAFGTTITRAGNAIAELTKIGAPQWSAGKIVVTNHDSANGYEEIIQGIRSGGDVGLEGNLLPGDTNGQMGLLDDFNAGTLQAFVITLPASTGTSFSFNAIVTGFQPDEFLTDGKLGFKVVLSISGKPTLSVATSTGLTTPFFTMNNSAVITPAASGSVYDYVSTVLTGVTSVTVTPTAAAGTIVITANSASQTVATGVASSAITLGAAGSNTTITVVVTETNKAATTYTIRVVRAAS